MPSGRRCSGTVLVTFLLAGARRSLRMVLCSSELAARPPVLRGVAVSVSRRRTGRSRRDRSGELRVRCGAWGDRRAATSRRPSGPCPTTPWPQGAAAAGSCPACCRATDDGAAACSPTRSERLLIGSRSARPVEGCWWTTNRYSSGSASRNARYVSIAAATICRGCCCRSRSRPAAWAATARRPGCRRRCRARCGRRSAGRPRSCWCRPRRRSPPCPRRRRACRPRRASPRRAVRGASGGARPTSSRAGHAPGQPSSRAAHGTGRSFPGRRADLRRFM